MQICFPDSFDVAPNMLREPNPGCTSQALTDEKFSGDKLNGEQSRATISFVSLSGI